MTAFDSGFVPERRKRGLPKPSAMVIFQYAYYFILVTAVWFQTYFYSQSSSIFCLVVLQLDYKIYKILQGNLRDFDQSAKFDQ